MKLACGVGWTDFIIKEKGGEGKGGKGRALRVALMLAFLIAFKMIAFKFLVKIEIFAIDTNAALNKKNNKSFTWGVGPYITHRLFNPDLPFSMETGIEIVLFMKTPALCQI